jgi:hypothetical protein
MNLKIRREDRRRWQSDDEEYIAKDCDILFIKFDV